MNSLGLLLGREQVAEHRFGGRIHGRGVDERRRRRRKMPAALRAAERARSVGAHFERAGSAEADGRQGFARRGNAAHEQLAREARRPPQWNQRRCWNCALRPGPRPPPRVHPAPGNPVCPSCLLPFRSARHRSSRPHRFPAARSVRAPAPAAAPASRRNARWRVSPRRIRGRCRTLRQLSAPRCPRRAP